MARVAIFLILLGATLCFAAGDKPVDLKLRTTEGQKVSLKEFSGHPVVLNFWATWCGPCRAEMPMLVEAEKKWSELGVRFIAVSLDDEGSISSVKTFVNRFGVTFPVWTGANVATLDRFRLGNGVPDTMFVDEHGQVYARVLGQIQRAELDERLEWLIGGRKGPVPPTLDNMRNVANR